MRARWRRWVSLVSGLSLLVVAAGAAEAEGVPADDPYITVAVARAKVEIACRDAAPAFQPGQNGWTAAWGGAERARMTVGELIGKASNREQAKGENQNEGFVEECNQRNASYEQEWNVLNAETRPLLESKLERAVNQFNQCHEVFGNLMGQEQNWKEAKLDLGVLEVVYGTVAKRVTELRGEAEALVKEAAEHREKWEAEVKVTTEFAK